MLASTVGSKWMRKAGLSLLLIFSAVVRFEHPPAGVEAFAPSVNFRVSWALCSESIFKIPPSSRPNYPATVSPSRPLYMYLGEEGASMGNGNGTRNRSQTVGPDATTTDSSSDDKNASLPDSSAGTFGDIMSPKSTDADILFRDGLVTSESNSLAEVYGIRHPMDRIAVTANGNLQRIISSYYDAPVQVTLKHCNQVEPKNAGVWDRRVHLSVFGQVFCKADSTVQVHNEEWRSLVESGNIGLGQLFRYQNVLPEFILHAAGPTPDGGFWRNYTLECSSMTCLIHEEFCPNVWDLSPTPPNGNDEEI